MDEFDNITKKIRKQENKQIEFESNIKDLQEKLELLLVAQDKKKKTQDYFLEFQYRKKRKYQEMYDVSNNIRFARTHAISTLDTLNSNQSHYIEHEFENVLQKIQQEIEKTEIEITQNKVSIGQCNSLIDNLYGQRSITIGK
ncbi:hypothetical protein HB943_14735 [Listeria weihenstephanensis]|uniref:DUF5082 domain-containing protein n=1 Tax=Listeria weihenstephanensis TaxID=1006155 RepID=A0A841Z964_9LIST|nr:hypothetical protein [Listeria weihenstephanensis]MBC1501855.1 hypothetical protein [Listeria weihenstephanensis]